MGTHTSAAIAELNAEIYTITKRREAYREEARRLSLEPSPRTDLLARIARKGAANMTLALGFLDTPSAAW
jgi:cell division protein FtsB